MLNIIGRQSERKLIKSLNPLKGSVICLAEPRLNVIFMQMSFFSALDDVQGDLKMLSNIVKREIINYKPSIG